MKSKQDIFKQIRRGDILVHHPYQSFVTSTQLLVEAAASDPSVRPPFYTTNHVPQKQKQNKENKIRLIDQHIFACSQYYNHECVALIFHMGYVCTALKENPGQRPIRRAAVH